MSQINIQGIDKAALLAGLYNAAKWQESDTSRPDVRPMTVALAQEIINTRMDYWVPWIMEDIYDFEDINDRDLNVNIGGDTLDPTFYDRDNGQGAAAAIVAALREGETK